MKRFGPTVCQTLIGFAALIMALGCNGKPDTRNAAGNVFVRIPFMNEGGGYSLQVVGLSGISSMYEFGGTFAKFYVTPSVDSSQKIRGTQPKSHFIKTAGNVYVPQDADLSLPMAVIYAHLERLSALDKAVGVGDLQQGPRDVGLFVRYVNPDNGNLSTNNAFYNPDTDSILLVPFTSEELPLAINGGVLAHEHFHSLFYKLVGRRIGQKTQGHGQELLQHLQGAKAAPTSSQALQDKNLTLAQKTNLFTYLGMNEGLADFWAWVYSGDPDFLASSLADEAPRRSMKLEEAEVKEFKFSRVSRWSSIVDLLPVRSCSIYCLGTEYAQAFKAIAEKVQETRKISSREARTLVAQGVVSALPLFAVSLKELEDNEFFEPVSFLTLFKSAMTLKPEETAFIQGIIDRTSGENTMDSGATVETAEGSIRPKPARPITTTSLPGKHR